MVVTELIDKDYTDIKNLLGLLSPSKKRDAPKEMTIPLLYELRDILNLYADIKKAAIYDRIKTKHHQNPEMIRLNETHHQLSILLTRCIRTIERREMDKGTAQFEFLEGMLTTYLDQEKEYLENALPHHFSETELECMGVQYETKKMEVCGGEVSTSMH